MARDTHIPIALWMSTAILAHLLGGGGAAEVAQTIQDRAELHGIMNAVRAELRPADVTFEILADGVPAHPTERQAEPPKALAEAHKDEKALLPKAEPTEPPPQVKPPKIEPPKIEPPKKLAPTPSATPATKPPEAIAKEDPPKPEPEAKATAAPVVPLAPLPEEHRLAVRQHAEADQPDNPNASRIADDANHVKEEAVAKIRSHDQDDPNPSLGRQREATSSKDEGDSDHAKVADSEDHGGDAKHAPGEAAPVSTSATHVNPVEARPTSAEAMAMHAEPSGPRGARASALPPVAVPATPPASPGGAGPASPEVVASDRGTYSLDPVNPGGDGTSRVAGAKSAPSFFESPVKVGRLGLGAPGALGDGPNINLTMPLVVAAVGSEKLAAERAADGAARRSAHRGTSRTSGFDRLRAAVENYDPTVKEGNQTALNAARVPFATYINSVHNRLHPIFAEEFLSSLDNLPPSHAFNQDLVAHLEIVLSKDEGRIVRLGVTRASGATAFDMVALNAVQRASPFGKAPDAIVSPDGNVYLHWEFHRDPFDACTTRNARPFLLKEAPAAGVKPSPPKRPKLPRGDDVGPILPLAPLMP